MAYKPNTTVYLCAGTGMDMNNSIWWHRFAYPWQTNKGDDSWWNTCFQFFKAHSISNGYWYVTQVDPAKGYFQVGRNPLNNNSIPQGQAGLGSAGKQAQIDNPELPFVEAIRAVDYLVFANDGLNGSGFSADIQYAFVTGMEYVNWNVARIYFTIDAIMTYQKFFYLGKSLVAQDMQFQERLDSPSGVPNLAQMNYEPAQFDHSQNDFVFQELVQPELEEYLSLGSYSNCMVISDINLVANDIEPSDYWQGIPKFQPSPFTKSGATNLGIGVFQIANRQCEAFKKLGSFNAMEHILSTYLVPSKICKDFPTDIEPKFVADLQSAVADDYNGSKLVDAKVPISITDDPTITENTNGYKPLNIKMYTAPYYYYSITDRQGTSIELQPQRMKDNEHAPADILHYFNVTLSIEASIAPNTLSGLVISYYDGFHFTPTDPMLSNWQMPSYTMTPNNSGWNSDLVTAGYQKSAAAKMGQGAYASSIAASTVMVTAGSVGAMIGTLLAPGVGTVAGGMIGSLIGGVVRSVAHPFGTEADSRIGQSAATKNNAIMSEQRSVANQLFGLPAVSGGLPQGYTAVNINYAGYKFYVCHLRTELMKAYDIIMSVFGYPQNKFRYPHINIRKRWCYVKLSSVNIVPIQANQYNCGGIPTEYRNQIVERLMNGVTFWNVRHALMGDGDSGASSVQSYTDGAIQSNINCSFIRNYGDRPDGDIMKENMSWTGGYANEYSDDYEYTP